MSKPYTLHGINLSGPTYKAGLMLAMSGQEYAYKHVDLRNGAHKKPEFLALNRYGQVPCLQDGALNLCQSGAILEYLADKTGKLAGKNAEQKARVREWLFWEFDKLSPNGYRSRAIKRGFLKADDSVAALYRTNSEDALKMLDGHLGKSKFLIGEEPTIADVAVYGVIAFADEAGFDLATWPNVKAWAERFAKLPGVKGPYELLPTQDAP